MYLKLAHSFSEHNYRHPLYLKAWISFAAFVNYINTVSQYQFEGMIDQWLTSQGTFWSPLLILWMNDWMPEYFSIFMADHPLNPTFSPMSKMWKKLIHMMWECLHMNLKCVIYLLVFHLYIFSCSYSLALRKLLDYVCLIWTSGS